MVDLRLKQNRAESENASRKKNLEWPEAFSSEPPSPEFQAASHLSLCPSSLVFPLASTAPPCQPSCRQFFQCLLSRSIVSQA